jgi:hypothetical protein
MPSSPISTVRRALGRGSSSSISISSVESGPGGASSAPLPFVRAAGGAFGRAPVGDGVFPVFAGGAAGVRAALGDGFGAADAAGAPGPGPGPAGARGAAFGGASFDGSDGAGFPPGARAGAPGAPEAPGGDGAAPGGPAAGRRGLLPGAFADGGGSPPFFGSLKAGAAIAIVFASSGAIDGLLGFSPVFTEGALGAAGGAFGDPPAARVSAGAEPWIPTIVGFRAVIGRICGGLARGSPPELAGGPTGGRAGAPGPGRAAGAGATGAAIAPDGIFRALIGGAADALALAPAARGATSAGVTERGGAPADATAAAGICRDGDDATGPDFCDDGT